MTQPAGYRQLADLVRHRIVTGELAPGQRLPGVIEWARQYGLSPITIRRAVAVLRNEGLVIVRHGYPSRVVEPADKQEVVPPPGATVTARTPTAPERAEQGIPEGVPLLVWVGDDGQPHEFPAHRFQFRLPGR